MSQKEEMSLFEKNQPNTIFAENLGPMLKKISFEAHIGPCNSISPLPSSMLRPLMMEIVIVFVDLPRTTEN